jgi:hypothetical protein
MSFGIAREWNRIRLCGFLLSHGYAAECLGTLKLIGEDRPAIETERHFRFLRGVAQALMGRLDHARRDLASDGLTSDDDGRLWRAAVSALDGRLKQRWQLEPSGGWLQALEAYPPMLRFALARPLTEAATDTGRLAEAGKLIAVAEKAAADPGQRAWLPYLTGKLLAGQDKPEPALASLGEAENSASHLVRTRAAYARIELALRLGRLTPAQAVVELETLRYAWRGDRFEGQVLRRLGHLQIEAGKPADGLRDLLTAARRFADQAEAAEIQGEAMAAFERLFLGDQADRLSPLTAVALSDEFRELAPTSRRSRELALRLSDRLIEADLLPQAARVLDDQLAASSDGPERARIGLKLAEVLCSDEQPQAALDALHRSAAKPLAADLAAARRKREAFALAQLRRNKDALAAVAGDQGPAAERLRATIHGSEADWGQAGASLSRLLDAAATDVPAAEATKRSRTLLDAAAALTLAGDRKGLATLAEGHGAAATDDATAPAFRLLTGRPDRPAPTVDAVRAFVDEALSVRPLLSPGKAAPAPAAAPAPGR